VIFPTIEFALFFAVVLPVSWLLLPHPRRWKIFILGASYFFYGSWDWRFCFLLALPLWPITQSEGSSTAAPIHWPGNDY
jgi:D-alanyl-lipoteichoic acid acyltransferase DltB (MBOAT superfamily)